MAKLDNKLVEGSNQEEVSKEDNVILLSQKKQELQLYENINYHLINYIKAHRISLIKFENKQKESVILFKDRSFIKELSHDLIVKKSNDFSFILKLKSMMPHNHSLHLLLTKLEKFILSSYSN